MALAGCAAFALIYPCYGLITAILLRGKSTSHDRWAKLMGSGVLFIGLGSFGTAAASNALADTTPPKVHARGNPGKSSRNERDAAAGRQVIMFTSEAWDSPGREIRFPVSFGDSQRSHVQGKSRLELTTGDGWLGNPWVKSLPVQP